MRRANARSISLVLSVCLLLIGPTASSAQEADATLSELREFERQLVGSSGVASSYAAIINFASEPTISSSTLWIDNGLPNDDELSMTKFPLRYEFDLSGRAWKPFVQATLAKLKLESTLRTFPYEKIKSEWETYSASLGGGVRIPLSDRWSILPAVDVGWASLSNDAEYTGPIGNVFLRPILDEILFDWSTDSWLANGHLAVQYLGPIGRLDVDAKLSGTLSHIESYRATTSLQEFSENVGTISFRVDGTYPLDASLAGYPLSVIGHLGSSTLVGSIRDALGFTYVNELGLSLQADITKHGLPVSKLSLGAMGLWGDNVKGWSLLLGYEF